MLAGNYSSMRLPPNIDIRHLRYFVAVAEARQFNKAVRNLYTSEPSLSKQIKDLEIRLGFPLFKRSRKSLSLTDSGRALYEGALQLLQHWEHWESRTKEIANQPPASFRLHVADYVASSVTFSNFFKALQQASPTPIQVIDNPNESRVNSLQNGDADFTFGPERLSKRRAELQP